MEYDKQVGELPSSLLSLVHSELPYPNILQSHSYFCFTCINLLLACTYVHHKHAWYSWRPEEGFRSLETGDTDNYDLPCGSSERAACALDRRVIYPAMSLNFSY